MLLQRYELIVLYSLFFKSAALLLIMLLYLKCFISPLAGLFPLQFERVLAFVLFFSFFSAYFMCVHVYTEGDCLSCCAMPLCAAALRRAGALGAAVGWRCRQCPARGAAERSVVPGWFPGNPWDLLTPRAESIPLKFYSLCLWNGGFICAVGVIVGNAVCVRNEVGKPRAYILGSQKFQIFFRVNLNSVFLL